MTSATIEITRAATAVGSIAIFVVICWYYQLVTTIKSVE
jgi:hypothetical protein